MKIRSSIIPGRSKVIQAVAKKVLARIETHGWNSTDLSLGAHAAKIAGGEQLMGYIRDHVLRGCCIVPWEMRYGSRSAVEAMLRGIVE